jgi:hypothetical protein
MNITREREREREIEIERERERQKGSSCWCYWLVLVLERQLHTSFNYDPKHAADEDCKTTRKAERQQWTSNTTCHAG